VKRVLAVLGIVASLGAGGAWGDGLTVKTSAFGNGQRIPKQYTGDGQNESPPLSLSGVPAKAQTLAITVLDPDAPSVTPFVHWLTYNLSGKMQSIPGHVSHEVSPAALQGGRQLSNGFNNVGYNGPAPPSGKVHHYVFTVYALDASLPATLQSENDLMAAMKGHVLAHAQVVGTYKR
jgi:hypothetical protein